MKALRRLTQGEVAQIGSMILEGNLEALKALVNDPASSALKVWFATVAINAIKKGDPHALNVVLDRIVGKPKAHVELSGGLKTMPQYSPEEAAERFEALQKRLAARAHRGDSSDTE